MKPMYAPWVPESRGGGRPGRAPPAPVRRNRLDRLSRRAHSGPMGEPLAIGSDARTPGPMEGAGGEPSKDGRRRRPLPTHWLLLPLFLLPACAQDAALPATAARDSAAITIVENRGSGWGPGEGWVVEDEPTLDVGVLEGDEPYLLSGVGGSVRLPDGRIVLTNGGTQELRAYDSEGRHLASAGGRGGGPGEFERIGRVFSFSGGDSLLVYDGGQVRASVFTPELEFVRSYPMGEVVQFPVPVAALDDGSLVAYAGLIFMPGDIENGLVRRTRALWVFGPDGRAGDSLISFRGQEAWFESGGSGGRTWISVATPLFPRGAAFAATDSLVLMAETDRYEVRILERGGRVDRIVRKMTDPVPVTPDEVEAEKEERLQQQDEEDRNEYRRRLDEMPVPETFPAMEDLMVDALDHIWVREVRRPTDPGSPVWTVFDPRGRLMGRVGTPAGLDIHQIGRDFVLGRWRDDLDVEHVRLHRLERPEVRGASGSG